MHPEARRELFEAIDYHNDIEPGLGESFLEEIEAAISLVEKFPSLWVEIGNGIRRCLVRRFPTRFFTPLKPTGCSSSPSCTHAASPVTGLPAEAKVEAAAWGQVFIS